MKKVKIAFLSIIFLMPFMTAGATATAVQPVSSTVVAQADFSASCEVPAGQPLTSENCGIVAYVVLAINILSGIAILAITASIMIAGYQYMTARDNSGQIEAARKRIVWAITALLLFIFMYAGLNFIVPGGVL